MVLQPSKLTKSRWCQDTALFSAANLNTAKAGQRSKTRPRGCAFYVLPLDPATPVPQKPDHRAEANDPQAAGALTWVHGLEVLEAKLAVVGVGFSALSHCCFNTKTWL